MVSSFVACEVLYGKIKTMFALNIFFAILKSPCDALFKLPFERYIKDTARITAPPPVHGALQSSSLHARALEKRGAALCAEEGFL